MRSKLSKLTLLAGLCLLVSGCFGSHSYPLGQLEAITVIGSDKTIGDQVISYASGKDCSSVRVEQGKTYCVEDEPPTRVPKVYCYRTLGQVTCYEQADPYGQGLKDIETKHYNPYSGRRF